MLPELERASRPLLGRRVAVYGGGNTAMDAARTAKRLGRRGGDRRLPADPGPDARARVRARRGGGGGRPRQVADHDQAGGRREASSSSGWSSTRPASPSRRASSRSWTRTRSSSRSARRPTSRCSTGVPGLEVDDGVVAVGPNMMTGLPGRLRRRRHGARPSGRSRSRSVTASGRPATSTPGCRGARSDRRRSTGLADLRHAQHLVLRRRAAPTVQPLLDLARRESTFDEVVVGLDASHRAVRGAPLPLVRQLLRCDNCYGVCPDNAVLKLGDPGERVPDRPRLLQGLRHLRRRVPVGGHRDGPRGDLISYSRFSARAGPLKKAPGRLVTTSRGSRRSVPRSRLSSPGDAELVGARGWRHERIDLRRHCS